jgi:hypothetical protein
MTVPTLAIPNPALVREPLDAVRAAITTFISGRFGVDSVNQRLKGEDGEFIESAISFIEEGNETFADAMAEVAHELMNDVDAGPVHLSFALAMSMAAEAGVYYAKGDDLSAWRRASFAAILFGVLAGSAIEDKGSLKAVMITLSEKGVDARHAKMRELRVFAVEKYHRKQWPSANEAAHRLKDVVMHEGERIGARLTDSNAQRTIAEWFRQADKAAVRT